MQKQTYPRMIRSTYVSTIERSRSKRTRNLGGRNRYPNLGNTSPFLISIANTIETIIEMSESRHAHLHSPSTHHNHGQCRRCGHKPGRSLETKRTCPICGKEMSRQGLHFHLKHVKCSPKAGLRKKKQYSKKRCDQCGKMYHSQYLNSHRRKCSGRQCSKGMSPHDKKSKSRQGLRDLVHAQASSNYTMVLDVYIFNSIVDFNSIHIIS